MSWIDSDLPQKQCCECFYWYPADRNHWALQKEGRYGLASRCKLCTVVNSRLLAEMKRLNPRPPEGKPPKKREREKQRGVLGVGVCKKCGGNASSKKMPRAQQPAKRAHRCLPRAAPERLRTSVRVNAVRWGFGFRLTDAA